MASTDSGAAAMDATMRRDSMRDRLLEDAVGRGSAGGKARSGLEGHGYFGVTAIASLPSLLPPLSKCRVVMPAREGGLRVSKLIEEGRGDLPDVMTARSTRGDLFVEDISNTHGFACWRRVLKTDAASWSLRGAAAQGAIAAVLEVFLFYFLKLCCGTFFAENSTSTTGGADA